MSTHTMMGDRTKKMPINQVRVHTSDATLRIDIKNSIPICVWNPDSPMDTRYAFLITLEAYRLKIFGIVIGIGSFISPSDIDLNITDNLFHRFSAKNLVGARGGRAKHSGSSNGAI